MQNDILIFLMYYYSYTNLPDFITKSIDATEKSMILLESSIDFMNRDVLIHKLSSYGIWGNIRDWFTSCVTKRYQRVCIDRVASTSNLIRYGIHFGTGQELTNLLLMDM